MDKVKRDPQTIWWAAGAMVAAVLGLRLWHRYTARRSSPLIHSGETRSAVITGASSGIGCAYAKQLAQRGYSLVLVARREERLLALADELRARYGVPTEVLTADLSDPEAVARVAARIRALPDLNILVNNAGFGYPESFASANAALQDAMVQVHVVATVLLTRAALPALLTAKRGAIVNVSSLAAFYPLTGSPMYVGTKSLQKAFSEALHRELRGTGVRVQALCPGFTRTEFMQASRIDASPLPGPLWMDAANVVRASLRDLRADQVVSVPGFGYRLLALISPLVPRSLLCALGASADRHLHRPLAPFPKRTYRTTEEALEDLRHILRHRGQLRDAMRVLDVGFRHRLLLAVTQVNRCRYCAYVHTRSALQDGMSSEEIVELMGGGFEQCPPDQLPALLYAQHWAESGGCPDADLRAGIVGIYGAEKAAAIDLVLRMINVGNYVGNAFDGVLYRISHGRWGLEAKLDTGQGVNGR